MFSGDASSLRMEGDAQEIGTYRQLSGEGETALVLHLQTRSLLLCFS